MYHCVLLLNFYYCTVLDIYRQIDFSITGPSLKLLYLKKKKTNSDMRLLLIHTETLLEAWNGKPSNVIRPSLVLSGF